MGCKISISFRRSKKEQKIYKYFNELEDKSIEIKNILSAWYESNVENNEKVEADKIEVFEKLDTDITDF